MAINAAFMPDRLLFWLLTDESVDGEKGQKFLWKIAIIQTQTIIARRVIFRADLGSE